MFENPEFEVDKSTEEYRLLKPLLTQLDKSKVKKLEKKYAQNDENGDKDEASTDDDLFSEKDEESSDDEDNSKWKEVKKEHKRIQKEKKRKPKDEDMEDDSKLKSIEMHDIDTFKINELSQKVVKTSLGARVAKEKEKPKVQIISGLGNRQMSFSTDTKISKSAIKRQEDMKKHREERKKVIRPTTNLKRK